MIEDPLEELSKRDTNLTTRQEVWPAIWITAGVVGGPVLLTMASLYFFYFIGVTETEVLRAVLYTAAFVSYVVLLPLAAGLAARKRERRQEIAGEMMTFFSARIVELYAVSGLSAFAEDPRTTEAFEIYARAECEIQDNVENPLLVQETVERGVALVDRIMADNEYFGRREPE